MLEYPCGARALESAPIRLLRDMVMIEPIVESQSMHGILHLPQSASRDHKQFRGKVLATGPGDKLHRWCCMTCDYTATSTTKHPSCGFCHRKMWHIEFTRAPMSVSPGDVVIYPHRADFNTGGAYRVFGRDVIIVHEQQFLLGVQE